MKRRDIVFNLVGVALAAFVGWWVWKYLVDNPERPKTRATQPLLTQVEALKLMPGDYRPVIRTRGLVRPRTKTNILPQVTGEVMKVSPNFREGGVFAAGEVLLTLDDANYKQALAAAEASVAQAKTALAEERARQSQAWENWKRLGNAGEPSDLFLRKPQYAEAQAVVESAEAEAQRAARDVERCQIKAPYDGRVLQKFVDVGQVVSPGTQLAEIYSRDVAEVRLPVTEGQVAFLELPKESAPGSEVEMHSPLMGGGEVWKGALTRVEGALDEATQQLYLIATIQDPWKLTGDQDALKIGMFLEADIRGKILKSVYALPRAAVRAGSEIVLVGAENRIHRVPLDPLWEDEDFIVVDAAMSGIKVGDRLCLTILAFPVEGMRVEVSEPGAIEKP